MTRKELNERLKLIGNIAYWHGEFTGDYECESLDEEREYKVMEEEIWKAIEKGNES